MTAAGATYDHRSFQARARRIARLATCAVTRTASGGEPADVDTFTSASSLMNNTIAAPTAAAVHFPCTRRPTGSHASAYAATISTAIRAVLAHSPGMPFCVHARTTAAAAATPAA